MFKPLLTIGALQLVAMLVMLCRTKLLAVFLGPEGVGLMAVVDKLVAVFAQLVSLSMPFAALRFLPELWQRDRGACYTTFRSMAATVLVLALVVGTAGVWLSLAHGEVWGHQLATHPATLAAAFVSLPALALWPLIQNAYAGTLRHRDSMVFLLLHAVVLTVTGAVGAWTGSLTVLYLCYAAAACALFVPALRKLIAPMRSAPTASAAGWRAALPPPRIVRFAMTLLGLAVLAPFAALYTHYWILQREGASAAGWMQAAIGISLAVRGVLSAAHQVYLTPHLNSRGTWVDRMQWADQFQHAWCLLCAVLVPPLLLGAEWALRLLYAADFVPATRFVALFVLTEVVGMLAGTYQALIVAGDRMRFHVTQNAMAQVLLLGVAWLTIPRWGIAGAALGALAAQGFLLACTLGYLTLREGLRPSARTAALMLYLVLGLLVAGWFGADGVALTLPALSGAVIIYLAIAAGLLLFTRADERARWRGELVRLTGARHTGP
jgi:O-antigen/teichoic acid export membrane protein